MADGVCREPEIGINSPFAVERQIQTLVAVQERPVRVVQEVIAGEAELKFPGFRFSESEVLEDRHVRVKEPWARQGRENVGALLTGRHSRREAGTIDVLVCFEATSRIA